MRSIHLTLAGFCLLVTLGCSKAEREATADDIGRFLDHGNNEVQQLRVTIKRFVPSNLEFAERVPLDTQRFVEWRKREWWRFQEALVWLMHDEWSKVEHLTLDAARYYGYQVVNFPQLPQDILQMFHKKDVEWVNLVMDVSIFLEWHDRELDKMQDDLKHFYARVRPEIDNLNLDLQLFLGWREREYKKLIATGGQWFDHEIARMEKLEDDWNRLRLHEMIQGELLRVDFANLLREERERLPKLIDGVVRFTQFREREWDRLQSSVRQNVAIEGRHVERLVERIYDFRKEEMAQVPLLLMELERFFETYEREVKKLDEDVKRFWRSNIALGSLLVADVKRFYSSSGEEAAMLEHDIHRFFAYGKVEWKDLQVKLRRFFTDAHDPVFKDRSLPWSGDLPVKVFDDLYTTPTPSKFDNENW